MGINWLYFLSFSLALLTVKATSFIKNCQRLIAHKSIHDFFGEKTITLCSHPCLLLPSFFRSEIVIQNGNGVNVVNWGIGADDKGRWMMKGVLYKVLCWMVLYVLLVQGWC
jgi:hypothetical protein